MPPHSSLPPPPGAPAAPAQPLLSRNGSAQQKDLLRKASDMLKAGQHSQAREICRRLLMEDPSIPEALQILGRCRFDLSQFATAPTRARVGPQSGVSPRAEPALPGSDEALRNLLENLFVHVGFRKLQQLGFHLQRNDFYSPLNDCDFLQQNYDLWHDQPDPPEIDWRVDDQLAAAREIAPFLEELRDIPQSPPADCHAYGWENGFWNNADALVQYGLVRSRKPELYVEIGCGWSSLLLKQALEFNEQEGHPADVTLIEPYPNPRIFPHLPSSWRHHPAILQRVSFSVFDALAAGDVLFYDGSHCSKIASDVNWFFFRVLPRLQPGVIIHLHDIVLPDDYFDPYVFQRGQTWNEQFLLQAFLMHNPAYRILIANRFLWRKKAAELDQLYRGIQPSHGCSFWMQKL